MLSDNYSFPRLYLDGEEKTFQNIPFFRSADHSQNIASGSRTRARILWLPWLAVKRREPSVQFKSRHTDGFEGIMEADAFGQQRQFRQNRLESFTDEQ